MAVGQTTGSDELLSISFRTGAPRSLPLDRDQTQTVMWMAGSTLGRLPPASVVRGLSLFSFTVVQDSKTSYGYNPVGKTRLLPSAADISIMDDILPCLSMISDENAFQRRAVSYRMMWNEHGDKPLWSWRTIAESMNSTIQAVRLANEMGILTIRSGINRNTRLLEKIWLYARVRERA